MPDSPTAKAVSKSLDVEDDLYIEATAYPARSSAWGWQKPRFQALDSGQDGFIEPAGRPKSTLPGWVAPASAAVVVAAVVAVITAVLFSQNGAPSTSGMVFMGMPTPVGDQRYLILAANSVRFSGNVLPAAYNVIQRSGDEHGEVFGAHVDAAGNVVASPETNLTVSNYADFTSLIDLGTKTCGSEPAGNILFSITHFEAPYPSSAYLTKLIQDPATGALTVNSTKHVDFSAFGGVWNPCAGSVTPWNTHLGSEESEPDARAIGDDPGSFADVDVRAYLRYKGVDVSQPVTAALVNATFLPYQYGWIWEAAVDPHSEAASVQKHYAMGRNGEELALVLPDNRTAVVAVDGTNRPFFTFVADRAGNLSAGCLFAAKVTQLPSDVPGGAFSVAWLPLGCTSDADIAPHVATTRFADLFDAAPPDPLAADICLPGFQPVNTGDIGLECLRLREGMQQLASRLESTRYAALLGATVEFNKWEGTTFDSTRNRIYFSISDLSKGMEDKAAGGQYDVGTSNDIRLPANKCGCVYSMDVSPADDPEHPYFGVTMQGLWCGSPNPNYSPLPPSVPENGPDDLNLDENNACDVLDLASPDNIAYVAGHDGVFVGEDTSGHQNDVLWYYDFRSGNKSRVHSTPFGSEVTSVYWHPDLNGFAYAISNVQHPYTESDQARLLDPQNTGRNAYVGYVGQPGKPLLRYGVLCNPAASADTACYNDTCDSGRCLLQAPPSSAATPKVCDGQR